MPNQRYKKWLEVTSVAKNRSPPSLLPNSPSKFQLTESTTPPSLPAISEPHVAQVPRRFHSPLVTKRVPFSLRIITLPQLPPPPETRKIPTAKVVTTAENIEKLEEKQRKKKEAEEEKEKRRIEREAKAREKAEKKRLAAEKKLQRAAAAAEKRLREADDAQARPERPRRERRKKLMTTSSTISTNFEFCCH